MSKGYRYEQGGQWVAYTMKGSLLTSLNQSIRGTLVAPMSLTNSMPAGRPAQSLSVCMHSFGELLARPVAVLCMKGAKNRKNKEKKTIKNYNTKHITIKYSIIK